MNLPDYLFTECWFDRNIHIWKEVFRVFGVKAKKVLEIGSFEGRSATWLMEHAFPGEGDLYCVDTWEGSREHADVDMAAVETRFNMNIATAKSMFPKVNVHKLKMPSLKALTKFIQGGMEGAFEIVYVDGSHESFDTLSDLALSYHLCRNGGLIFCDDYLFRWGLDQSVPKSAIDAVVNSLNGKLQPLINVPLYQLILQKKA